MTGYNFLNHDRQHLTALLVPYSNLFSAFMAPWKNGRPPDYRPLVSQLSVRRRVYGLRVHHRMQLLIWTDQLKDLVKMKGVLEDEDDAFDLDHLTTLLDERINHLMQKVTSIIFTPPEIRQPLRRLIRTYRTIESFSDEECKQYFRFNGKEQLLKIFRLFRFPDKFVYAPSGNTFTGHEVLLVTLYKFHECCTHSSAFFTAVMGLAPAQVSMAINCFLDFFIDNWVYLVTNHLEFWVPYFRGLAEAGRWLLVELFLSTIWIIIFIHKLVFIHTSSDSFLVQALSN
jgi:hypothetical protein